MFSSKCFKISTHDTKTPQSIILFEMYTLQICLLFLILQRRKCKEFIAQARDRYGAKTQAGYFNRDDDPAAPQRGRTDAGAGGRTDAGKRMHAIEKRVFPNRTGNVQYPHQRAYDAAPDFRCGICGFLFRPAVSGGVLRPATRFLLGVRAAHLL